MTTQTDVELHNVGLEQVPEFAVRLQKVRDAARLIAEACGDDQDVGELLADFRVYSPEAFAQIVMNHLPPEGDVESVTTRKMWWMRVGAHLGPDWIGQFRSAGAFMDRVDSFKFDVH